MRERDAGGPAEEAVVSPVVLLAAAYALVRGLAPHVKKAVDDYDARTRREMEETDEPGRKNDCRQLKEKN